MKKPILVTALSVAFFLSCKTEPDDYDANLGLEYFPLEIGKFLIYEVDSTIFDPNADTMVFTTKTFVKEEIMDTLADNLGNTLYRVERSQRKAEGLPWEIQKVLTLSVQGNQAIRTEDNLRIIKLTFPLRKNNTWDGLVHLDKSLIVNVAGETLIMFQNWGNSHIEAEGEPDSIGSFVFDEVATLLEADEEDAFFLRVSREKYAKGIGLVQREVSILDANSPFCQTQCQGFEDQYEACFTDCMTAGAMDSVQCVSQCAEFDLNFNLCIDECLNRPWLEKAEKGFILKQTIISHN